MRKILIIEDEENIRRLLNYDLKHLGYDVTAAKDGQEGMDLGLKHTYDVIVVDWMMPYYSGVELVKAFRNKGLDSIIIMLTAKDEESDILDGFDAGVDDYMSKPFSPRELGARIQAHLKRHHTEVENLLQFGNLKIDVGARSVTIDDREIALTKKEFDLLLLLLTHENKVLSRDRILNEIWDFNYDGDTRIVDVHIFKVRAKIETSDYLIHAERGIGYVAKRK